MGAQLKSFIVGCDCIIREFWLFVLAITGCTVREFCLLPCLFLTFVSCVGPAYYASIILSLIGL